MVKAAARRPAGEHYGPCRRQFYFFGSRTGNRAKHRRPALALTLPDICGGIAFPEIVKKYRDGRVMLDRQNNPTREIKEDLKSITKECEKALRRM